MHSFQILESRQQVNTTLQSQLQRRSLGNTALTTRRGDMNKKVSKTRTDSCNVPIQDIMHNLSGFETPQIEIQRLEIPTRPDRVPAVEVNGDIDNLVSARGGLVRAVVLAEVVDVHVEEEVVTVHQLGL
jgi:hypothetical protein